MSDDGVVEHDEVLPWLPTAVQREWAEAEKTRLMAMPPEERGWATAEEVDGLPGEWIEVLEFGAAEPYYLPGRRP